jgi:hypothetical protein
MTALLWAEWKQLMRTLRSRRGILDLAVVFVGVPLIGFGLGLVLFISNVASAPGRSPAGFFVTALLVLLTSIPLVTPPHTLAGVLPEWAFAQPIPARKAMVFTWLIASGTLVLVLAVLLSPVVFYSALKGSFGIASASTVAAVFILNAILDFALLSQELTGWKTNLALVGKLWKTWAKVLFLGAVALLLIVSIETFRRAVSVDWEKFARWLETPAGMVVTLPVLPAYYAVKSVLSGFEATAILSVAFLALFTAIMVWEALKVAATFCQAVFLLSERQQWLTKIGAWEVATQRDVLKPVKSESGFGLRETSLLWLYWLNWKRSGLWSADLIVPFLIFAGTSIVADTAPIAFSIALPMAFVALAFTSLTPEWLKSQPMALETGLIMLALPTALRAMLWGFAILLAFMLRLPESMSAVRILAFIFATIAFGFGTDFASRALRVSGWTKPWDFLLAWGIALVFAFLVRLTLLGYWFVGLLLSWAACGVFFRWAKEEWQRQP